MVAGSSSGKGGAPPRQPEMLWPKHAALAPIVALCGTRATRVFSDWQCSSTEELLPRLRYVPLKYHFVFRQSTIIFVTCDVLIGGRGSVGVNRTVFLKCQLLGEV